MLLTNPQLSVDLWSSGTLVAALHVGQQLFEGHDELTKLQAVIDVLGPPLDVWPGCVELYLWGEYDGVFGAPPARDAPPNEKLASREVVRPLPEGHPAIDLILRLLMWDPGSRLTAAEALQHPRWIPRPSWGPLPTPARGPAAGGLALRGLACLPTSARGAAGRQLRPATRNTARGGPARGPAFLRSPTWTRGVQCQVA